MRDDEARKVVEFIDKERQRQNLTQNALAEMSHLDSGGISRIFSKQVKPTAATLEALARALGYGYISFLLLAAQSISGFRNAEMMRMFAKLPAEDQDVILDMTRALFKRHVVEEEPGPEDAR